MNTIYKSKKIKTLICALAAISIVMLAFGTAQAKLRTSRNQPEKQAVTSDAVVLEWNEIAINAILPNGPPFEAARRMAIEPAYISQLEEYA